MLGAVHMASKTWSCNDSWSFLMRRLFGLPIALALTAGFIQSAISPTVLVTGMLELQRRGYGQDKSVSSYSLPALHLM